MVAGGRVRHVDVCGGAVHQEDATHCMCRCEVRTPRGRGFKRDCRGAGARNVLSHPITDTVPLIKAIIVDEPYCVLTRRKGDGILHGDRVTRQPAENCCCRCRFSRCSRVPLQGVQWKSALHHQSLRRLARCKRRQRKPLAPTRKGGASCQIFLARRHVTIIMRGHSRWSKPEHHYCRWHAPRLPQILFRTFFCTPLRILQGGI
mmetsp:Transcript_3509/g.8249  ORF Transcript_3509/g.8249 Transcript_3509/m.8249 type:complete len:204 (-) Transcript_3509:1414-2025(-)